MTCSHCTRRAKWVHIRVRDGAERYSCERDECQWRAYVHLHPHAVSAEPMPAATG